MVVPNSTNPSDKKTDKINKVVLKVLVPANVAGSIIGKGGDCIKELKSKTSAHIRVSGRDEIFPYTDERIILIIGKPEDAMEVLTFIHTKLRSNLLEESEVKNVQRVSQKRLKEMKLIVADTTAGKIIGKKGETVKKLQEEHKIKVILTSKDDWGVVPGERVATVAGPEDAVNSAIEEILQIILGDKTARLNKSLVYPPYPMFDHFAYHGPPEILSRGPLPRKNMPPKKMGKGGFDNQPRYNGYQSERPRFPFRDAPPRFY